MDTVVDLNNKDVFLKNRINVVLPRTVPYDTFLANEVLTGKTDDDCIFVSLGLDDMEKRYRNNFLSFHKNAHILIDVANAHMQKIVDIAKELKRLRPDIKIMVGNIANPETYWWYAKNDCVDFIKISIGSGNACLTSKNSGVGMPMASLIQETYQQKQEYIKWEPTTKVPAIVADGGMKNYSDIIKAFALGCFLPNTLVYTKNGFKKIQNININDYVFTHTGEYKKVVNTFKYENNKDIILINNNYSTNNHNYYVVNKKHKNVVTEKNIKKYAEWISAENLTSEYLLIKKELNLLHLIQMLLQNIFLKVFIKKHLYEKKTNKPIH